MRRHEDAGDKDAAHKLSSMDSMPAALLPAACIARFGVTFETMAACLVPPWRSLRARARAFNAHQIQVVWR